MADQNGAPRRDTFRFHQAGFRALKTGGGKQRTHEVSSGKPMDSGRNAAHVSSASSFTLSEAVEQRTRTWFCSLPIQTSEE